MALTMSAQDDMDIDIDMDVDGPVIEEEALEEGEEPSFVPQGVTDTSGQIPAIYLEDPAQEPQWEKVHVRGVDDLSTDNIRVFATDYYPDVEPHVQWVDDTSANLVYKDSKIARQAMLALIDTPTSSEEIQTSPLEARKAKQLLSHPASILIVRVATVSDRKRKNARDASRYYLLHPEADPTERMKKEFANGRAPRGENGDYRRRQFDEREHKRRRDQDHTADSTADFEASMYDDAPAADTAGRKDRGRDLFSRVSRNRRRSASPNANGDAMSVSDSDDDGRNRRRKKTNYRKRDSPPPYSRRDPNAVPKQNLGKELFGTSESKINGGMRSADMELFPAKSGPEATFSRSQNTDSQRKGNEAAARRLKADLMASISPNTISPRTHRRSRAIDSRVDEDLSERFGRKSISLDSTKSVTQPTANSGKELFGGNINISMKGSADQGINIRGSGGFSIKGRADAQAVKELFPEQYNRGSTGVNAGKELFDQVVRPKGRRQRAGDLFEMD